VASAMARSKSPLARQMTARLISGDDNAGSNLIASLRRAPRRGRRAPACRAAVLVRIGILRHQPDRLVVIGDGVDKISLGAEGVAAVVEDGAVGRPDPQRVVEIGDDDVVFAFCRNRPSRACCRASAAVLRWCRRSPWRSRPFQPTARQK
jgi:hypothetical protein